MAGRRGRYSLPAATATDSFSASDFTAQARRRATQDFVPGSKGAAEIKQNAGRQGRARYQQRNANRQRRDNRRRNQKRQDKNTSNFNRSKMQFEFQDDDGTTEALFQRFWQFQQLPAVYLLLWTLSIFSLISAITIAQLKSLSSGNLHLVLVILAAVNSGIGFVFLLILHGVGIRRRLSLLKPVSCMLAWVMLVDYCILVAFTDNRTISSYLSFAFFAVYLIYGLLALTFRISLLCGVLWSAIYIVVAPAAANTFNDNDMARQVIANIVVLGVANAVGGYLRYNSQLRLHEVFRESRFCQQKTIHVDSKHKEKDVLLSSLLPEYMIEKVKGDIMGMRDYKENSSNPLFRALYVDTVESISILFADIVGFTKLSSGISAKELVKVLNRLFGKFDQLAEKNHCYRIKILGDCYYCVAGLLDAQMGNNGDDAEDINQRRDHATDSVEMGLDMCVAIDMVRRTNDNSKSVDMRVGVHTGWALIGIIGQKKWQYDVWSNAVTQANHMESGGIPGQVHVSQDTLNSMKKHRTMEELDAAYIIEEGNGAKRDAFLEKQNVETYIFKSRTPRNVRTKGGSLHSSSHPADLSSTGFSEQDLGTHENENAVAHSDCDDDITGNGGGGSGRANSTPKNGRLKRYKSRQTYRNVNTEEVNQAISEEIDREQFLVPAKDAQDDNELLRHHMWSIWSALRSPHCKWHSNMFLKRDHEIKYHRRDEGDYASHFPWVLVLFYAIYVVQGLMIPRSVVNIVVFSSSSIVFATATLLIAAASKRHETYEHRWVISKVRQVLKKHAVFRDIIGLLMISVSCFASVINSVNCQFEDYNIEDCMNTSVILNRPLDADSFLCDYPHYFFYTSLMALMMSSVFLSMMFVLRLPAIVLLTLAYGFVFGYGLQDLFLASDLRRQGVGSSCSTLNDSRFENSILLAFFGAALIIQARQADMSYRLKFQKEMATEQALEMLRLADDIKELVLENILPKNIADYYIKFKGPWDAEDLYAEKHEDICVMFAAIPEFMKYCIELEQSGDKGGIGAIRVLNEIISDFDAILSKVRFNGIEKIKTIGATYMAASGLSSSSVKPGEFEDEEEPVSNYQRKKKNLDVMIQFAVAVMKSFHQIRAHLFLTHEMRVGINVGPVVAGVIGRSKPMYDIWGNTVNVASRMESTGALSEIQVTKDIADIAKDIGHKVEYRGSIFVKGKGDLDTYYVLASSSKRAGNGDFA